MERAPYLVFSLRGLRYAVDALAVREIFWLPELTPIEEAPAYIAGVVNLRGRIVPVTDLDRRMGHAPRRYCLLDNVIVLERDDVVMGVIVHEVREVRDIAAEETSARPSYGQEEAARSRFVGGMARVEDDIVMLLDLDNLIRLPDTLKGLAEGKDEGLPPPAHDRQFCPEASEEERAVFRDRAGGLRRAGGGEDIRELIPLAVVGLNGEYFGVELGVVREFYDLRKVVPVPCCPAHIVGQTNLRGEILTVVDIRPVLEMPAVGAAGPTKVVVVRQEDVLAGVWVEEVFDVVYLRPADMVGVPSAVKSATEKYLKGAANYGRKMLGILDLPKILASEALVVNEDA